MNFPVTFYPIRSSCTTVSASAESLLNLMDVALNTLHGATLPENANDPTGGYGISKKVHRVWVQNVGSENIYWGIGADVLSTDGAILAPGEWFCFSWPYEAFYKLISGSAIDMPHFITASTDVKMFVMQERASG